MVVNVTAGQAVYKNAERPEASGWGGATLLRKIIAMDVKARGGRRRDLTRRMLYLPALIVAAVLLACAGVVLVVLEKAEATFPGKNGRIVYAGWNRGKGFKIYTINARGGIRCKSPTTMWTSSGLPTRPTARGSPTRRSRETTGSTR